MSTGFGLDEAAAAFVARLRVAHLATTYADGTPHVIPVSPALDGERLVLASERETRKVRNIAANPRVAVCFDEYVEDWNALRQVVLFGTARVIGGGPDFERARGLLYEKYTQYPVEAPIEEGDSVIIEVLGSRAFQWGF
jgi:PPOX class probable F420-dependent enzyme